MANCSDFTLKLSGHPFKLKQALDDFIKNRSNFSLREIYDENFTHTPPTWELHGEGRWGVDMDNLVILLEPYQLSGTLVDIEPGCDFFVKIWLENGIIVNTNNTYYISEKHYEHCPDNSFWYEQLSYAIEDPETYPEVIEFMLKYNIIPEEDLEKCTQKNR